MSSLSHDRNVVHLTRTSSHAIKFEVFHLTPTSSRDVLLLFHSHLTADPDGYWIEIIRRSEHAKITNKYNFAQTMFRVKDPVKSLEFYRDCLGMTLLAESHLGDFSLYFLAQATQNPLVAEGIRNGTLPDPTSPEAKEFMKTMFGPVIELTHNHGTELNPDFK